MADLSTPKDKVKHEKNSSPPAKKKYPVYCIVCRSEYLKHEGHVHLHSMFHHRELDAATGKKELHTCQACNVSSMNLQKYAEHISTAQHKVRFKRLISKNVKPISLHKVLGQDTIDSILKRNKTLRKEEKKAKGKKKKKRKQVAAQESAHLRTKVRKTEASDTLTRDEPMHGRNQQCSNNAVFQNIENKVSPPQRLLRDPYSFPQNQNARGAHFPQVPSGHQPTHFGFNSQQSKQASGPQRLTYHRRPYRFHMATNTMPQQPPWPPGGKYYREHQCNYTTDEDFSKDHYPHSTSFFNQNQGVSQASSQPQCPVQPTSRNPPVSSAPIKEGDVSGMLKQIRRALGVREPCRADREARKQNGEASQPGGGESKQSASKSASAPPGPSAQDSSISSAKAKNKTVREPSVNSSEDVNGLLGGNERESHPNIDSQTSLSQSTIETTFCEPTNSKGKVRIAHNSAKAQELMKTKLQPTLNKLQASLSGAWSKHSLSQMNDGVKTRKTKVIPRFATKTITRVPVKQRSKEPVNNDLPLSEGFQWESFSCSPLASHSILQPAPQHTADTNSHTQSGSLTQQPWEQSDTGQQVYIQTEARLNIKMEPNSGNGNLDSRLNNGASKRKLNMVADDGVSDQEQSTKKKKKSNNEQDQMDQLLAVSLREEELSHSMVDLDKSLVQARNTLQVAYAEVQRLLILRQQFVAEVNTLRTKRIEILQGMQEGFPETSNVAAKATTSSAGAAASSASPTASNQPSPATTTASSVPVLNPAPIVSLKQEVCRQACSSPQTTSHTTDASPSHSAIPATAAAPAKQPQAQCTSSLITHPPPESSTQLQEKEKKEKLTDSIKTEAMAKETQAAEKGEETRGHQDKVSEADTEDSNGVKLISAAVDEGNESDASIEMVSYSAPEIIHIDESDKEDSPDTPELPETTVIVESTSSSTQTCRQTETEIKYKAPIMPVKDTNSPTAPVEDEEPSLGAFLNHTGSVHGLQIHDGRLYTCSGDNTARAYSLVTRECLTVFERHTNKVNCLLVSSFSNMPARLYTGSSDQTICCFSIKTNKCLEQISLPDRVLCLHIAWNILYVGLANGSVASYDLKTLNQLDMFECHGPRGVSCLGTTQEGARRLLLVGSYDSTISVRDAKSGLLLRTLEGHTKTVLCMKVVNDLVFSGSSDTSVHAHNIHTGELVRIYKGHGHAVTSIVILGKVMVTACLDKLIRVYELQSHDRLQVYGGHSDMVMCMAVHKSVIYTGCYDGTVQAVKLNLMKNHRCWWQNCSLIFGIADHLAQHLINDHSNPNLQTMKCRWRGCDTFFSSQKSVQQDLPEHMQTHVQNDSKVQP